MRDTALVWKKSNEVISKKMGIRYNPEGCPSLFLVSAFPTNFYDLSTLDR